LAADHLPMDLRTIAMQLAACGEASVLAPLAQARSMAAWHARRVYCSVCAAPLVSSHGGYMRVCETTDCGAQHFPRTDPVVIMLPILQDKCLLGRNARFPNATYSALAGFMEPGETIEEAVRRETMEEVGIKIGRVRYVMSQPWPFPSCLMIGCMAEALSGDIHINPQEIEHARWVTADEAAQALAQDPASSLRVPPDIAIAHHLLKHWLQKR
jgi:NAD+ diphosphatase